MSAPDVGGRITAIVVSHDSGELLAQCAGRLLDEPEVRSVVVVDNASVDGSVSALLAAHGDRSSLEVEGSPENLGYARAVNRGLARVGTELALLVNPDCIVAKGFIEALVREMDREAEAAVVGGIVLGTDGALQQATRRSYPSPRLAIRRVVKLPSGTPGRTLARDYDRSSEALPARPEDVDAVSGALMLVRMAAVDSVGRMDGAYFLHCEDLDWCIRFRRAGWRVRFVPAGFAVHVKGTSSQARPLAVQWHLHRGMHRFYRKFEADAHNTGFNLLVTMGIACRWLARSAKELLSSGRKPRSDADPLEALRTVVERADGFRSPSTLVVGASSPVAAPVLESLASTGEWTLAVSRGLAPLHLGERVVRMRSVDGTNLPSWARRDLRRIVHLAPLPTLAPYLEALADAPIRRVVACSSTSVFTKADSPDPAERELARALRAAEEELRRLCAARGIELVLLRPTVIYLPGHDRSLERIGRVIRRTGVFPIAGRGRGLRQPVHAEDLAHAIRAALERPSAVGRTYTISGGEVLTYREMVDRIFRAAGRRSRIVPIPVAVYRLALAALARLPGRRHVPPRAADRMNQDMAFDHDAAARDLDFRPRSFLESR